VIARARSSPSASVQRDRGSASNRDCSAAGNWRCDDLRRTQDRLSQPPSRPHTFRVCAQRLVSPNRQRAGHRASTDRVVRCLRFPTCVGSRTQFGLRHRQSVPTGLPRTGNRAVQGRRRRRQRHQPLGTGAAAWPRHCRHHYAGLIAWRRSLSWHRRATARPRRSGHVRRRAGPRGPTDRDGPDSGTVRGARPDRPLRATGSHSRTESARFSPITRPCIERAVLRQDLRLGQVLGGDLPMAGFLAVRAGAARGVHSRPLHVGIGLAIPASARADRLRTRSRPRRATDTRSRRPSEGVVGHPDAALRIWRVDPTGDH